MNTMSIISVCVISGLFLLCLIAYIIVSFQCVYYDRQLKKSIDKLDPIMQALGERMAELKAQKDSDKIIALDKNGFTKEMTVQEAMIASEALKKQFSESYYSISEKVDESDLVDEDKSEFLKDVDKLVPSEADNSEMFKGF